MRTIDRRAFLEMATAASALAAIRPRTAAAATAATAVTAAAGLKKAVYVSMLPKELGYLEKFRLALDVGFEGIEIGTITDATVAAEIKEVSAKTGLKIHSVMNADHWRYPLSSADPEVVAKSVAGMETSLRNARAWGADAVLLVPGVVNAETSYKDAWTRSQKVIKERILPLAQPESNLQSSGHRLSVGQITVLPGIRQSNLGVIIGLILAVEVVGLALAFTLGPLLFRGLAAGFDTKRSIMLSLLVYAVIAVWGFFINSVIEFWFLAWMVAIVQGGSQALSRSLYAAMSPAAKSGEFFGLFSVMEKFSSLIGPLMFAAAGFAFGSSRPAVLSLIVLFILGGFLLSKVNVEEGKRVAQQENG